MMRFIISISEGNIIGRVAQFIVPYTNISDKDGLRTKRTKGSGSRIAALTMTFKLALEAQKTWKRL